MLTYTMQSRAVGTIAFLDDATQEVIATFDDAEPIAKLEAIAAVCTRAQTLEQARAVLEVMRVLWHADQTAEAR